VADGARRHGKKKEELLYDFVSGRLADWGGEPYGRKVDPGRFWQWAVKRMGYSIISLAQGDFFQKTVLLVCAVFQFLEQRAVRIRVVFRQVNYWGRLLWAL
jgi:hypothetical protein